MLLAVLLIVPLCLRLGIWQLDRAQQKAQLQQAIAAKDQAEYQALCRLMPRLNKVKDAEMAQRFNYHKVVFSAQLDAGYYLLDNQIHESRPGYSVLQLARVCAQWVLLDRGFVSADVNREILPKLKLEQGEHTVQGYLYRGELNRWIDSSKLKYPQTWPKRIAQIDYQLIASQLKTMQLLPMTIRLASEHALVYSAHWQRETIGRARHLGYAFQWFAIALSVCILYGYFCFRRDTDAS